MPTYPSAKPTFFRNSDVSVNVGLGEGFFLFLFFFFFFIVDLTIVMNIIILYEIIVIPPGRFQAHKPPATFCLKG